MDDNLETDDDAVLRAESTRRMAEIERGEAVGEPAEKIFAELRQKYSLN
jgi:hypothetical protein